MNKSVKKSLAQGAMLIPLAGILTSCIGTGPLLNGTHGASSVKIKIAPSHCAASSDPVFTHPGQWAEVRESIDGYMIFHTMLPTMPREWLFKKVDPGLLADFFAKHKEIQLEMEGGPFDKRHTDTEPGFGMRAADSINAKALHPLREAGAAVASMTFDSTMTQLVRGYDLSKDNLEPLLAEVAACVHSLKQRDPKLRIGVIHCARNVPWTEETSAARRLPTGWVTAKSGIYYRDFAEAMLVAMEAAGTQIDFIAVECPYDLWKQHSEKAGGIVTWAEEYLQIQAWCAKRDLPLELVINAHPVPKDFRKSITPPASEEENASRSRIFHDGVLAYIRDLHDAGIQPNSFKIQSWYTSPSCYLPETEPHTFMNTARDAIRLINELYPKRGARH